MLLKDKRVFVVEDDPSNLAVISSILKNNGAYISYDQWGDTTLDKLRDMTRVDIILLDLMLPGGGSGYDVFEAIRVVPELADIPIVVVTASDPDIEMSKARDKGLNGYISKPLNRLQFPKQIAAVLNGEEVWGELY
ncbi:MAG: response regulator [Ardenticatenaceae bacterium]|nr:response regulator [Ardenticatenaceae bacterium]